MREPVDYEYIAKQTQEVLAMLDPDQAKISKWAVTAMKWGVDHGVISGTNKGVEPQGNATRAQIAVILRGFDNNVREY